MTGEDLIKYLRETIAARPIDRTAGGELIELVIAETRAAAETERAALVAAMRQWLELRSEPWTMLAADVVAEYHLSELREELFKLLDAVAAGQVFHPGLRDYYARRISDVLSRI